MSHAMMMLARLDQWRDSGAISTDQHARLSGLCRGEPFSLFLELNILLYAGVLFFVGGLGWTVATWSERLGDILVLAGLTAILAAVSWYCSSKAPSWSPGETPSPTLLFDYVLYLGCLTWTVELGYLENRFHLLSGKWDLYLLFTALLLFAVAYRFDNRFVLSLALSSLAGWFGLTISHVPTHQDTKYRNCAIVYSLVVGLAGVLLQQRGLKPHFFTTYLNVAANVLFWAVLSGVFGHDEYGFWFLGLLAVVAASLAWGLTNRQFVFVAYAIVYGYIGLSSIILRTTGAGDTALLYFLFTGTAVLAILIQIARRFARES